MFLAGFFTVAQLSFWGNYLPRVYPTHLRGTGEGFAANIGGRMLGTGFAFVTTQLANVMPGATPPTRLAYAAALVGFGVYLDGLHRQLVAARAQRRRACLNERSPGCSSRCSRWPADGTRFAVLIACGMVVRMLLGSPTA